MKQNVSQEELLLGTRPVIKLALETSFMLQSKHLRQDLVLSVTKSPRLASITVGLAEDGSALLKCVC